MILIDLFSILLTAAFYPCMALLLLAGVIGVGLFCVWLFGVLKMVFFDNLKRTFTSNKRLESEFKPTC